MPQSSLPHIRLNGRWLEQLDFTVGRSVTAIFKDSCLTLKAEDLKPSEEYAFTACVTSRLMGNKPRTQLFLNGLLLMKYGFKVGDRIGLSLTQGMIQITRINTFTTEQTA